MKISVLSIPVSDQEKALLFYTEKLGFVKKHDVPVGGGNRWLTLTSSGDEDGVELLLEPSPNDFEPAKTFQKALFDAGIPWTQFSVEDTQLEYERLLALGVEFKLEPKDYGTVKVAVFNDTCGNYIQIVETL